jgi:CheY-like chemotaxis protein
MVQAKGAVRIHDRNHSSGNADPDKGYLLVISDIDMPLMTGFELCKAARDLGFSPHQLPFLAHSANPDYERTSWTEVSTLS